MLIVQVKSRSPDACSITTRVRKTLLSKTDSSKLEKWKGADMGHPLIFPPWHERLGVREHTRPACRFDQSSSARASVVHRRNEVGLLPAQAMQASSLHR